MTFNYPDFLIDFYNKNKNLHPVTYPNFLDSQKDINCGFYAVNFNFDEDLFLEECKSIDNLFCDHRSLDVNYGDNHRGWKSITLHGIDEHKTEHFVQYGYQTLEDAKYKWTDVCQLIPNLHKFLSSLPYKTFDRVRIMRLEPGGFIMPHTDGLYRMFGPLNIAINQPEDCFFVMEDVGIVPFKSKRGMILDVSKKHCVINFSSQIRYHVIVHGYFHQDFYVL